MARGALGRYPATSRLAGCFLTAFLALAGCGGSEVPSGPQPPPPPTPPPPPPVPIVLFDSPIEGIPGGSHWYGAYLDHSGRDYACGVKYYSGHRGVDILLRNFQVQDSGVKVVAAARGTVIIARDNQPDRNTVNGNRPVNEVTLDHGGGVTSYYLHLRTNSLVVALNQTVEKGQPLGLVGSSGNSNWPHLHFEVNNNGLRDPYAGSCNRVESMWLNQLAYQNAFAVVDAGLTLAGAVSFADLLEGPAQVTQVPSGQGSALVWYNVANIQSDSVRIAVKDPAGVLVAGVTFGRTATFSQTFVAWRLPVAGVLVTPGVHTIEMWQRSPSGGPLLLADTRTLTIVPGAPVPPSSPKAQISTQPAIGKVEIWSAGRDQPPVPW